ncbi:Protein of unknown function (DUF3431) domain containing protein [Rhypophila decipiens]
MPTQRQAAQVKEPAGGPFPKRPNGLVGTSPPFLGLCLSLPSFAAGRLHKVATVSIVKAILQLTTASNLTVNLVIASLAADDISWTEKLRDYLPNLRIIRYVSDSTDAPYHPPVPRKGREALIYHTYFYDFYDDLPDISIMAHPHENPWHVEPSLLRSMTFALTRLNLQRVLERRYFNLRISWREACPARINTTRPEGESTSKEESYMRQAFKNNFDGPVPDIMAGACCSQFAVSRDAIRRNPRSQYKKHMNWLISTGIRDYITGRVWEHLWPWLFLGEAVNCPPEKETYCNMYGVCFDDDETPRTINEFAQERRTLEEKTEFWIEIFRPYGGVYARKRIPEIDGTIRKEVALAVANGARERTRNEIP